MLTVPASSFSPVPVAANHSQPTTVPKNAAEGLGARPGPTATPARKGRHRRCKKRKRRFASVGRLSVVVGAL